MRAINYGFDTISLSDYFYQDKLAHPSIELALEDLFPESKIEFPLGHSDNDFTSHHLALEMCKGTVLAGVVVAILADGFMGFKISACFA